MPPHTVDPTRLQLLLRPYMDELVAARVKMNLPIQLPQITSDREELEQRLMLAFSEIDLQEMPAQWSWQEAAKTIAAQITDMMIKELQEKAQR